MPTVSFLRSRMPQEKRLAMLPRDVKKLTLPNLTYFETDFGVDLNLSDLEYSVSGANVSDTTVCYNQDIICQPKFWPNEIDSLKEGQTLFGWLHFYRGIQELEEQLQRLCDKKITAIAFEYMCNGKRHVFWKNNQLTGQLGIRDALFNFKTFPDTYQVAVIGKGNVAKGALNELKRKGIAESQITIYDRSNSSRLPKELEKYDLVVNCARTTKIILNLLDLRLMKDNALLVDLAEGIYGDYGPRSLDEPNALINNGNNQVYCIDHVPTLDYKRSSRFLSRDLLPYIELLTKGETCLALENATVIKSGVVNERLVPVLKQYTQKL